MQDLLTYLTIIAAVVFVLYGITARKTGWHPSKVFGHLRANGANGGIKLVVIATAIVGILLSIIYQKALAEEWHYFERTTLFAGIDHDIRNVPVFCYQGGVNDRLTSNVGIKQHLIGRGGIDILAQYTHHSCALNKDKPTYDAVGVTVEWTFKR